MKTHNKSNLTKAIQRFDVELKKILMSDLLAVKSAKDNLVINIKSIHKEVENHHWTVA